MSRKEDNIEKIKTYSAPGEKRCLSNCDRDSVFLNNSQFLVVCHYCERILRVVKK